MTKTVLITGCSTGLGKLSARLFAERGWNVVATMRKPEPSLAEAFPDRVLVQPLDVTDSWSIEAAVQAGVDRFGGIDVVVNNAGVTILSILEATPESAVKKIFDTNVFGVMNVMRVAVPVLRQRGGGTIVNVTSAAGYMAVPLLSLYVASKHAVEGLSESLAYELESQNIRMKLVEPGTMHNTAFAASGMAASGEAPVPEGYRPYFDHALKAMMEFPFDPTDERAVAETVFEAATDETSRLRHPVGPDAEEYARLRWSTSEDEYRAGMSRLTGQVAWREKAASRFA